MDMSLRLSANVLAFDQSRWFRGYQNDLRVESAGFRKLEAFEIHDHVCWITALTYLAHTFYVWSGIFNQSFNIPNLKLTTTQDAARRH